MLLVSALTSVLLAWLSRLSRFGSADASVATSQLPRSVSGALQHPSALLTTVKVGAAFRVAVTNDVSGDGWAQMAVRRMAGCSQEGR